MSQPAPSIFVTRRWPDRVEARLAALGATLREDDEPLSREALTATLTDHDVVCTTITDRITPDMLTRPAAGCA